MLKNWKSWIKKEKKVHRPGLVGIHPTPQGIAIAYLDPLRSQEKPYIEAYSYQMTEDLSSAIRRFVVEHALEDVDCCYVLPSSDYTLTMVDTPNVAQTEKNSALQWLVREVINFPIEDALLDSFELPLPRSHDNVRLTYVIVVRRSIVPHTENLIHSSGLTLKYIDIPELMLRNIAFHHPEEAKGLVVLQLFGSGGR